uniref:Cystatin domain-containing protein n=1 Tax=Seriola lalandi dorsalis TaxID=1841481 RepID=A0A3B4XB37_SERLL
MLFICLYFYINIFQIVKGIRYIVDLEISRTVCRKRDHDNILSKCDFHKMSDCFYVVVVVVVVVVV